jgi:hypothetical protein
VLLLLEQEHVTSQWQSPNCLAVCRVWKGNTLIISKIGTVILSLASFLYAGYFSDDLGGPIIGILEEGAGLKYTRVTSSGANGLLYRLKGVD